MHRALLLSCCLASCCLAAHTAIAGEPPQLEKVAVLTFKNPAGLTAQEVDYLSDLVRGAAANLPRAPFRVLTRENILELIGPDVDLAACVGRCEIETGRNVGADLVVTGEIVKFGSRLKVSMKLHDTRDARLLAQAKGSAESVDDLEKPTEQAAARLFALARRNDPGLARGPALIPNPGSAADAPPSLPHVDPNLPLAERVAALDRIRAERLAAERERTAVTVAAREHHLQAASKDWAIVRPVAEGGGPEGIKAIELFLGRYSGHPLGNPLQHEATQLLDRIGGTLANGYILIRSGAFSMGAPSADYSSFGDEVVREIRITRPFLLKRTAVTQGEWKSVMGNDPAHFAACGDDCPVESVSWFDAIAYVNALSVAHGLQRCYVLEQCTGLPGGGCHQRTDCQGELTCASVAFTGVQCSGYRLPTEAEWEYAARAGGRAVHAGAPLSDVAWYDANAGAVTHPVGRMEPNDWGLVDLLGNVWEWTHDIPGRAPGGVVVDPTGADSGTQRVIRGCSWYNDAATCRDGDRYQQAPAVRDHGVGFRPARTIP